VFCKGERKVWVALLGEGGREQRTIGNNSSHQDTEGVYLICGRKSTLSPARMENSVSGDEGKEARVKERGERSELCSDEEKHRE